MLFTKYTDPPTHIAGEIVEILPAFMDEGRQPVSELEYARLNEADKLITPIRVVRQNRVKLSDDEVKQRRPVGVVEDLVLSCPLSPGDIIVLTAIVRELHRSHPGKYRTFAETWFPELWMGNPHITPESELIQPRRIDCDWRNIVEETKDRHRHLTHWWRDDLEDQLGIRIPVERLSGDVFLSDDEQRWPTDILGPGPRPFALMNAGVKPDMPAKGWGQRNYQAVVDSLGQRIECVQIGTTERGNAHGRLSGATDLLDKTSVRDLCRVMRWADLVITGISFPMHLCAAIPRPDGSPRPFITLAGGLEPPWLVRYPNSTVLSSVGCLSCCQSDGCGRPLLPPYQSPTTSVCVKPIQQGAGWIGRCMDLITVSSVLDAVEHYVAGGQLSF